MAAELDRLHADQLRKAIERAKEAQLEVDLHGPPEGDDGHYAFKLGYVEGALESLIRAVEIYALGELDEVAADAG